MDYPKQTECVVIGGGIIGLAIARELALANKEVVLLEKNSEIGEETSFRNSAVIHAGVYYPKKSLKAKLCNEGKQRLYDYCQLNKIDHKKVGKLIVATQAQQLGKLNALQKCAYENGVPLQLLDKSELSRMEPNVNALTALYSSETGIVNGAQLMHSFENDILKAGGIILCNTAFVSGKKTSNEIELQMLGQEKSILRTRYFINAAGLWAQQVARNFQDLPAETIPPSYFAKGNYFQLKSSMPFKRLIYPLPETGGLGIHATINLAGQTFFGPDVEWVEKIEYSVSPNRRHSFVEKIKEYYPGLDGNLLSPAYAGIRPKISPAEQQPQDFIIQTNIDHGLNNVINLYGLESPGLTACMAIAKYVTECIYQ